MSSEEECKILKMVAGGKITAEQAMTLMKALVEDEPEAEIPPLEAEADLRSASEPDFGLAATAEKARSLWQSSCALSDTKLPTWIRPTPMESCRCWMLPTLPTRR